MAADSGGALWGRAHTYERFVGRWSRLVAPEFLAWLDIPWGSCWLDVGCGTGELSRAILGGQTPASITGVDTSEGFLAYARECVQDGRARFDAGDAQALPYADAAFDVAVAGLLLNHVPEAGRAVTGMARVTRSGGIVGAYVWDYSEGMQMIRHFWDAAVALNPGAAELDQGRHSPLCRPHALGTVFRDAGLKEVETRRIEIATHFADFDDYWSPFLGGQGVAPGYAMSLNEERRAALRERLRVDLPVEEDGSIRLMARVWAARGRSRGAD